MSFSKYRVAIPAAVFACLFAASSAVAQNSALILRSDSGNATFLGITMYDVTASNMSEYKLAEEKGAIVRSVQEGSPAEEADLRENDVIIEFAGQSVWSARQLSRLVSETPAGRRVAITVSRDGNRRNLSAALRARTADIGADNRMDIRFFDGVGLPSDLRERILEAFPGDQSRPPRITTPQRPDVQGGRQNTDRSAQRPRLGVEVQALTEQMAEYLGVPGKKGALIASVLSGGASDGKLKAGDVVVGVNDREISGPDDFTRFIREAASGEITVNVIRDKKQIAIRIILPSDENQSGGYRL